MTDIPAARNTLRVLAYLARHSGPLPASVMARDLQIPRSSVYQLLAVMRDEGFLVHYPEDRVYGLSGLLSEIGSSSLVTARLGRLAAPLLSRLVRDSPVPVVAHLGSLSGSDVVYVLREQGFRAPMTVSNIGVRLPAHLTATGRAMLSALPDAQVRALYPHASDLVLREGRIRRDISSPRTLPELHRILADTRERGWSVERGDITADYSSVAAAALDRNDYPVAAVGLTFRDLAADPAQLVQLGEAVVATASALTVRVRGRG